MKRIAIATAVLGLLWTPATSSASVPRNGASQVPAGLTALFKVKNFATWKAVFDRDRRARRAAGIQVAVVMRERSGARRVIVHLMAVDKQKMMRYVNSARLGKLMRRAGVVAKPVLIVSKHRDLDEPTKAEGKVTAGVVALFDVRHFGRWLRVFKSGSDVARRAGIIAHVIARGPVGKQRTRVVALLGGTNAARLKGMVESKETAQAMARGGVIGRAKLIYVDVIDSGGQP